jgi:Domain of unknown function (DUF4157)
MKTKINQQNLQGNDVQIRANTVPIQKLQRRKCACGGKSGPTGACTECQKKRTALQRKKVNSNAPTEALPIVHEVPRISRQSFNSGTKEFVESQLGFTDALTRYHDHQPTIFPSYDSRRQFIQELGGELFVGPSEDAFLKNRDARAATLGKKVLVRSDIYNSRTSRANETFAHEGIHLIQQQMASSFINNINENISVAESEADSLSKKWINGFLPQVNHRDQFFVPRFQLNSTEFDSGIINSPSNVRNESSWVENEIDNYALSNNPPYTFTIVYFDGTSLIVPLTMIFLQQLSNASTFYRRHTASGRIVPFQFSSSDPRRRDPAISSLPWTDALIRLGLPRFDNFLTPRIIGYLNDAQMMFLAQGILDVVSLRLANPLSSGPASGLSSTTRTMSRLAATRAVVSVERSTLIAILRQLGVRFSEENILFITRTSIGRIVWMEIGSASAGMRHIVTGHAGDFLRIGIRSEPEIQRLIFRLVRNQTPIRIESAGAHIYETVIDGVRKGIQVVIGENGFIVTAFPITL